MTYLDGLLDFTQIKKLVDEFEAPLHLYSIDKLQKIASQYKSVCSALYPDTDICFASKANPSSGAMRFAAGDDLGCDAVSEFEFKAALKAGINPSKIYCNGNAKSDNYLRLAIQNDSNIILDNDQELDSVKTVAESLGKTANVLVRFSNIPGLDGLTSKAQSTATNWTKFGFSFDKKIELVQKIYNSKHLNYLGPSAHIGTQLTSPTGFINLLNKFLDFSMELKKQGIPTKRINLGGGFPVNFFDKEEWYEFKNRLRKQLSTNSDTVTWDNLAFGYSHKADKKEIREDTPWIGKSFWSEHPGPEMLEHLLKFKFESGLTTVKRLKELDTPKLVIEPGRSLFAPAGITIAKVNNVKEVMGHLLVSVEMGIVNHGPNLISNDIFTMSIEPVTNDHVPVEAFIAGQLCFSSDMISKNKVKLNRLPAKGDLLIIHNTGAYAADHFASNSCGFPRPAKVAIHKDGTLDIWRKRETFEEIFS